MVESTQNNNSGSVIMTKELVKEVNTEVREFIGIKVQNSVYRARKSTTRSIFLKGQSVQIHSVQSNLHQEWMPGQKTNMLSKCSRKEYSEAKKSISGKRVATAWKSKINS